MSLHLSRRTIRCLAIAVAPAAVMFGHQAMAATDTWNPAGNVTNNWSDLNSWGGIAAPVSGDVLNFAGGNTTNTNDFPAQTTFDGITFAANADPFTLTGNAIQLGELTSGSITSGFNASSDIISNSTNVQTISLAGITLSAGKHAFTTTNNSTNPSTLAITAPITRNIGTVVVFNTAGSLNQTNNGVINLTGALANDNSSNGGILGGWATIVAGNTGAAWATMDANGNVVAYTGYTDVAAGGTISNTLTNANVRIGSNSGTSPVAITAGTTAINTLQVGGTGTFSANQTILVGAGNKLVLGQNGGIFNVTGLQGTIRTVNIGQSASSGGILTAGDGTHSAEITLSTWPAPTSTQVFTVNSAIQNNGGSIVSVTVNGGNVTFNSTANTYSGGTYVISGRLLPTAAGSIGTGNITIFAGGQVNTAVVLSNNFTITGSGNGDNGGLGAIRLSGTARLTGTITLVNSAEITTNSDTTGSLGVVGKITGAGALTIGSPTATSLGSGVFVMGATSGAFVTNDYSGDTTIAGTAASNVSTTLKIGNPSDTNILPHGATGSFSGGATGNLVLRATDPTRQAIFDLNGSTQTINGLVAAAGNQSANNIIRTSSTTSAQLILGDNNATATYTGTITNGSGSMALTKIGAGTQTLAGNNTYTGLTTVTAGTLSFSGTSSSIASVTGAGTLAIASTGITTTKDITVSTLNVDGKLTIAANSSGSRVSTLNNTGLIDLNTNALAVQSTDDADKATKLATLIAQVTSANHGGDWLGTTGITSAAAIAKPSGFGSGAVGVFVNSDFAAPLTTLGTNGPAIDNSSLIVAGTYNGDANLDGKVDILDLTVIANHWQSNQTNWAAGDIDFSGFVDIQDLTAVANNWQVGVGPGFSGISFAQALAEFPTLNGLNVPEPASLALLFSAIFMPLRRKRS